MVSFGGWGPCDLLAPLPVFPWLSAATCNTESLIIQHTQTWRNRSQIVSLSKRLDAEWPHLLFTSCLGLLLTNRAWSLLRSWDALGERKNSLLSADLFLLNMEVHFKFCNTGEDDPAYLLWSLLDLGANFSPCLTFLNGLDIFSFAPLFPWILCDLIPNILAHCNHKKSHRKNIHD